MGLRCCFFDIRLYIVTLLALIPINITGSPDQHTMPLVLHILHSLIIGLQCFWVLIRIRIITLLTFHPLKITGFRLKLTLASVLHVLHLCSIGLQYCFLIHIRISILIIFALIPYSSTGSQVKRVVFGS
jgi:hypothetical protein